MSERLLSGPNDTGPGAYAFDQCVFDREFTIVRFTLRASEVAARLRERDPNGVFKRTALVIVADTFIIDNPVLDFEIVSLTTRVLDCTAEKNPLVMIERPASGTAAFQIMFGELRNGPIRVVKSDGHLWTPWERVVEPTTARGFTCYYQTSDKSFNYNEVQVGTPYPSTHVHPFYSALRNPQLWNVAKAQFAAATLLLDQPARRAEAISMLEWIVFCTTAIAKLGGPLLPEALHMSNQVNALLLFAKSSQGARNVPVWSEQVLRNRISDHLSVLESYEHKIRTLELREDIQGTVTSLSDALKDVSAADASAIEVSLRLNEGEITAHTKQFKELMWSYEVQEHTVKLAYIVFKSGLASKAIIRTAMAVLEIVGAVVQMGAACYTANFPDPKVAGDAATSATKQSVGVGNMFINAEALIKEAVVKAAVDALKKLKTHLELSAKIGVFVGKAAEKANELNATTGMQTRGTIDMPELAAMGALDPDLDWNIFIVKIEVMLQEFISDPDGAGTGAVHGAREYFIALRTLAEYGRALSLKTVALAQLHSRSLELAAQLNAAKYAADRWATLHKEAKTAAEKLSVCRAMLLDAALNTKRSLVVLSEGYRSACVYNNLSESRIKLRLTMDHAAMKEEFYSVKNDIGSLFVAPVHEQKAETDFFDIPVFHPGPDATLPTGLHAILSKRSDGKWQLNWTLPISDPPFKPWLSSTPSLFFVEEARFYLEGLAGIVSLDVGTSGQYDNGYLTPRPSAFVSQGQTLDFIYDAAKDDAPSSRWKPVGMSKDNYLRPTPFTSWVATINNPIATPSIKKIRMKLWLVRKNAPA